MAKLITCACGILLVICFLVNETKNSNDFPASYEAEQILKKLTNNMRYNNNLDEMKRAHFWKRYEGFNSFKKNGDSQALEDSDSDIMKKRAHFWKRYDENKSLMNSDGDSLEKRAHFW